METGLSIQPAVAILGPRQVGKTTLVNIYKKLSGKQSHIFWFRTAVIWQNFNMYVSNFLENYQEKIVSLMKFNDYL